MTDGMDISLIRGLPCLEGEGGEGVGYEGRISVFTVKSNGIKRRTTAWTDIELHAGGDALEHRASMSYMWVDPSETIGALIHPICVFACGMYFPWIPAVS